MSAVALDGAGRVLATIGDNLDRDFFLRSAPKPLQAAVSQRHGAALGPEQLAIASASHSAFPIHVAYVEAMLVEAGLDLQSLRCPPSRPSSAAADRIWARLGRLHPERVFHNCSGKHAAMLRACAAQGWSMEYTDPGHPLQKAVIGAAAEAAGRPVQPVGVDGCGVPTIRSDVIGLARIFGRLVQDPEYAAVARAAARFAALTSDGTRPEARLAAWLPSIVKGGAEGCIGLGMLEHGVSFGAKCWTGQNGPAVVALLELIGRVGLLPDHPGAQLEQLARPLVLGGGLAVGAVTLLEEGSGQR